MACSGTSSAGALSRAWPAARRHRIQARAIRPRVTATRARTARSSTRPEHSARSTSSATRSRRARPLRRTLRRSRSAAQEIEDKDKSEVERLAGTAKEASEKLTAAEARARDLAIRLSVAETASALGITGASVKAAVRLLDTKALEFDEDTGEPTNVEKVLKALVAEYPMLATDAGEKPPAGAAKGTPPTPKPNGIPTKDQAVDDVYKRKMQGAGGLSRW
jgi:hypothetical protein